MEAGDHDVVATEADDTDELISTDVNGGMVSGFDSDTPAAFRDHCDLLLDAIDAQLNHLQTRSSGLVNSGQSRLGEVLDPVTLDRSGSVSRDTGLGSADPSTDKATSTPDGSNSGHPDPAQVMFSRSEVVPARLWAAGTEEPTGLGSAPYWLNGEAEGPVGSRTEQCLWRLQHLLGTNTRMGVEDEEVEEEASVRTEDFSARFREEMLELQEPSVGGAIGGDSAAPDVISISSDTGSLTGPQIIQNQNILQRPASIRHKAAPQVIVQNRSGRRKNSKSSENHALSSDDEGTVEIRQCYKVRSPAGLQRREKNQNKKKISTPLLISTHSSPFTTREKQNDKLRTELQDLDLTLNGLHQRKAAVVQVVERLREEVEKSEKERHTLQFSLTQTQTHTQLLRSELQRLQAQKEQCVKEARALQEVQDLQRLGQYRDYSPHRMSSCVSVLEREEMDRQLDSAKSELFSEQRRFRHQLDLLQERLEEAGQELEQKEEEGRSLREKCSELQEKLSSTLKNQEELQSVQCECGEQESRLGVLEKILAQKEVLLLGLQEEQSSLQTELQTCREEHRVRVAEALTQVQREKVEEVEQLKVQLTQTYEHQLQMMKEQEVRRLQEVVQQQGVELRRREEELKREAREQVRRAVERERRRWEEQKGVCLREQQSRLEEKMKEVEKRGKAEVERERRSALTLQRKVLELQTRMEELEAGASAEVARIRDLKDEHQAELHRLGTQLKQEAEREAGRLKQNVKRSEKRLQELKRVQKGVVERLEQQSAGWARDILTECVHLQNLLTHSDLTTDTKPFPHNSLTTSTKLHPHSSLTTSTKPVPHNSLTTSTKPVPHSSLTTSTKPVPHSSLTTSTKHRPDNSLTTSTKPVPHSSLTTSTKLHPYNSLTTSTKHRPDNSLTTDTKPRPDSGHTKDSKPVTHSSLTAVGEAVQTLQSLRAPLQKLFTNLHTHLTTLTNQQLRTEQEQVEKLSRQVEDDDGVAESLRRQLQPKDEELWRVQKNQIQWKQKTSTHLNKHELERRGSESGSEPQRRLELLEAELRHLTQSCGDLTDPVAPARIPRLPSTPNNHDLASYKLLKHLQTRIRQLRADSQNHPLGTAVHEPGDQAQPDLETVPSVQKHRLTWSSGPKTASSEHL